MIYLRTTRACCGIHHLSGGRKPARPVLTEQLNVKYTYTWRSASVWLTLKWMCRGVHLWKPQLLMNYPSMQAWQGWGLWRLTVCVPLQFICWKPNPQGGRIRSWQCGGIGRWRDPEGGALVNRISALITETPKSFLTPHVWGHSEKMTVYEPGSRSSLLFSH